MMTKNSMEQHIIDSGKAQKPPTWSKIPDCACYRVQSETRNELIEIAVNGCLDALAEAMNESGACPNAFFALLGSLYFTTASMIFQTLRRNEEEPILDEDETAAFMLLLKDGHQNAVDRFVELQLYYKKRG